MDEDVRRRLRRSSTMHERPQELRGRGGAIILPPMRPLAVSLFACALSACVPTIPEGRFACDSDDDCPTGMVCRPERGRCYSSLADAGVRDAGARRDAGGPSDGGAADASAPADAGLRDAGPSEAGPADAEPPDASVDASTGAAPTGDAGTS